MAKDKAKSELLAKVRDCHQRAVEFDDENRRNALDDVRFVTEPGAQWDEYVKKERGDRITLEFNRLRVTIKRVVNDMRMARPSGKVLPAEDSDKQTALALEGLVRSIWNASEGDSVIDQAAEWQVMGGMGAWRVVSKYNRDDAWEQDLALEAISNPLCLYRDPASRDPVGRDAEWWILTSRISKTAFKEKYGNVEAVDFEGETEFDDDGDWEDEDSVRIAEFWYKSPTKETLLLLSDGRSVRASEITPEQQANLDANGVTILKTREIRTHKIKMCIASGNAILEEGEWVGNHFPFVVVYGDAMVVDGKYKWWGLTRHSKDAQRGYNYSRTLALETVALAPQAKYWATATQAAGHTDKWAVAHKELLPFQLYNPDPQAPGAPQRMPGADIPAAWINEIQLSGEDIKATSGIFDASLGARTNESSGVAIRQRQMEGSMATWNYQENLSRGIRRTWEIIVDAIPRVYDTQRQLRILGVDGTAEYLRANDGIVDFSRGKYDVSISTGPSFSTQRQEAAEVYTQFAQAQPAIFPIAGDLIFKALDLPYADKIAERLKTLLPPQIQQMESQGAEYNPQVMLAMQQAEQAMAQVQAMGEQVQLAAQEIEAEKQGVEKEKLNIAAQQAQFKVNEANIAKQVAEFQKLVAETQAQQASTQQSDAVASDREALSAEIQKALAEIQQQAAQYMQDAIKALSSMAPTVVVANQPKTKLGKVRRVNGGFEVELNETDAGNSVADQISAQFVEAQQAVAAQAEAAGAQAQAAVVEVAQQAIAVIAQQTEQAVAATQAQGEELAQAQQMAMQPKRKRGIARRQPDGSLVVEMEEA